MNAETQEVSPIIRDLHEAGWFGRADLDPATVTALTKAVIDSVADNLRSEEMAGHVQNWVPLGFDPKRDPYANTYEAAQAILAEVAASLDVADPRSRA